MTQTNEHSLKTIDELKSALASVEAEIANTEMVQCSLGQLCQEPSDALARAVRTMVVSLYGPESTLTMEHVKSALKRLCVRVGEATETEPPAVTRIYTEEDRIKDKPEEMVELFRNFDEFCDDLSNDDMTRNHRFTYTSYKYGDFPAFCSAHLRNSRLYVSLKLPRTALENPPGYVRDVSEIRHCGIGDTEIQIANQEQLEESMPFIREAFMRAGQAATE
jgi:predicted transport protein